MYAAVYILLNILNFQVDINSVLSVCLGVFNERAYIMSLASLHNLE